MSPKIRTVAILTGAVAATTLAAAAATATPSGSDWSAHMGDQIPAHMAGMDRGALDEMDTMLAGNASVDEMHRWMADQDVTIGQMYRDMNDVGMSPDHMRGGMTSPNR